MKHKYTVIHSHDEGLTLFTFECDLDLFDQNWYNDDDQRERLAKALSINYEPHKGETLELTEFDNSVAYLDRDTITKVLGNNA